MRRYLACAWHPEPATSTDHAVPGTTCTVIGAAHVTQDVLLPTTRLLPLENNCPCCSWALASS